MMARALEAVAVANHASGGMQLRLRNWAGIMSVAMPGAAATGSPSTCPYGATRPGRKPWRKRARKRWENWLDAACVEDYSPIQVMRDLHPAPQRRSGGPPLADHATGRRIYGQLARLQSRPRHRRGVFFCLCLRAGIGPVSHQTFSADGRTCQAIHFSRFDTVLPDWIAAALGMGHRSNVSRAVAKYRNSEDRDRRRLKYALMQPCKD